MSGRDFSQTPSFEQGRQLALRIADGVLWARFPLPFSLSHVNVYLVEDEGGWAAIDTGIFDEPTRQCWDRLLEGPLAGSRLSRIVVTHHHPDHMGMAGMLAERFSVPIHMPQAEYLFAQHLKFNAKAFDEEGYRRFYRRHGMSGDHADAMISQGHAYKRMVDELPWTYQRLTEGEALRIGGREFQILTGGGHSLEMAMLHSAPDGLFFAADQVMQIISPNVSVNAINPDDNPLGQYLGSLRRLKRELQDDVLVLPGHHLPFLGLHERIEQLIEHHDHRCELVNGSCQMRAHSAAELVPVLFDRKLDIHQESFAFSETLAHMNYMAATRKLRWIEQNEVAAMAA